MSACVLDSDDAYFDAFTRRAAEARVPLDASIEITHRCNLRCVHCYLGDQKSIRQNRHDELSTREVKRLLDEMAAAGTLNFTFTGGDPMVRKDFPQLYEHAVRNGFLVTVFCDGALITPAVRRVFTRLPPRKVEVSLYGATAGTYEAITQVPGSHARCMEGIRWLHDNGIRMTLKTVLMRENHHELDAMRAIASAHGSPFYFDTALFPCLPHDDNGGSANADRRAAPGAIPVEVRGLDAPLAERLDPAQAAAAHLADPKRVEEMVDLYLRTRSLAPDDRLYRCAAGRTTVHVDPYGNLQPCTISTNGGANVRDGGFLAGWNGPLRRVRDLKARPGSSCQTCDKQALCAGCPAVFAAENGAGDVKSDYVCRTTHLIFEDLVSSIQARLQEST